MPQTPPSHHQSAARTAKVPVPAEDGAAGHFEQAFLVASPQNPGEVERQPIAFAHPSSGSSKARRASAVNVRVGLKLPVEQKAPPPRI